MKDSLKQRLVGALILIALAVVFWPIIFVPPSDTPAASDARIPAPPQVDRSPLPLPSADGLRPGARVETPPADEELLTEAGQLEDDITEVAVSDAEPESAADPETEVAEATPEPQPQQPQPQPQQPRSEAPVKPTLDAQGLPIAWILQVASVSSEEKAEALRKRLIGMELEAYSKRVSSNGKQLYRVYVGPKVERARLEQVKTTVDRELKVNSLITRYLP